MRRTTAFALATGSCDQRVQPWPVDRRMIGGKHFECVGFGEQSIAPFFQRMLAHRILLFYANRRPEDAPFLDELYGFERENRRFTFVPTMTRIHDSSAAWTGETGRIDPGMILRHTRRSAAHANAIYYIAGPPQMVAGLHSIVSSVGVDEDDIRIEDFAGY